MEARQRGERGEFLDEFLRCEDDVRRAVAPAVLEAIEQAAVFEPGEALRRNRRARSVAAQALEATPVARGDGDVRVHADAADARAALALQNRQIVGVDAVAEAQDTLRRARARRNAARHRAGVERREQRLVRRQGVAFGCFFAEPATLEQARQAPRDLPRDTSHLGVVGWCERMEAQRSGLGSGVDAIEHERMKMGVQVQRIPEALHEGDGAAVPAQGRPLLAGAPRFAGSSVEHDGNRRYRAPIPCSPRSRDTPPPRSRGARSIGGARGTPREVGGCRAAHTRDR